MVPIPDLSRSLFIKQIAVPGPNTIEFNVNQCVCVSNVFRARFTISLHASHSLIIPICSRTRSLCSWLFDNRSAKSPRTFSTVPKDSRPRCAVTKVGFRFWKKFWINSWHRAIVFKLQFLEGFILLYKFQGHCWRRGFHSVNCGHFYSKFYILKEFPIKQCIIRFFFFSCIRKRFLG